MKARVDVRPKAMWKIRDQRLINDSPDFENFVEEFQQSLLSGWEWKGVWVGCEAVVVVPTVSVTMESAWMVTDATTAQPSIDSVGLS